MSVDSVCLLRAGWVWLSDDVEEGVYKRDSPSLSEFLFFKHPRTLVNTVVLSLLLCLVHLFLSVFSWA